MNKHRVENQPASGVADASSPGTTMNVTKQLQKLRILQHELEQQVEDLRRANAELETSRDKYALLYNFAPVGYFTFDRDGSIRSVNLTGANMLGSVRTTLTNLRFDDFVADEDHSIFVDFLRVVFQGCDKMTCRVKLSPGDWPPLHVRIEAMAAESGDECHAAMVDITERKRWEEYVRESEYNLAKAQSMSHVGSWRSDPLTGVLRVSDELLRIMNISRDEATPDILASLIHPEDRESVMARLRQGAEQGANYEVEHRLLLKDGTSKWVYSIVEPSVNIARQVVKLYGTTQDITERKQHEVRLRNKKNELQAIFDSVNDGVIVFDHDGKIQHLNHVCPQFFPPEVLAGGGCREVFHPERALSPHNCPVELALGGERVETSMISEREGHNTRYIDITANPIRDELGEKTRALVFMRDVTLKRLQEMQLIQTEKMSSIGVLATGIAHEINNPLTSVAGYAEALLRRFRDEPSLGTDIRLNVFPKYLEVIVREAHHCKGIISNLLNFGRKSDGVLGTVNLNGLLLEILELLKHQPRYHEMKITVDLKENVPVIIGDPSGLRQVFMNLLINACHAIKDGGVVELSTTYNGENRSIYIQIQDTGCGIEHDLIDRIWDPFFTTKEVGEGVGLGLALTYNIVKRHGGEIKVESFVGKGSKFTVMLPVCREQADQR
ncbi:MAG: PAS domain S-box protein [Desulfuromonadaceae bacterium]|nr:PAS domain S-box protein [Desulfuromonadaceae bacterium]MDD5104970.1 PAS domain S-box protein [Desulfuromonadaceae bacterium]